MHADLARLVANQPPFQLPEERFKVWPTSSIAEHLQAVLECDSAEALSVSYATRHEFKYGKWRPPRPRVVEAYLFFSKRLREYLDDDPEELPIELVELTGPERAELLVQALIRNIQLVTIELEQEDDAQVIFETLNARGEPLTPSDLVRNFFFLTATRDGLDVAAVYSNMWRDFDEGPPEPPFWKVEERQGRLKRPRLDLFLFHYVWCLRKDELKIGHLYQSFRDWWDDAGPRDVVQELQSLREYAAIYRHLLDPSGSSRFDRFARRLRVLDTSTVYPVVLHLARVLGVASPDFEAIIADLESFLVRRAVCGYNQKAYNRIFLDYLRKLEHPEAVSPLAVHELLASSAGESAVWPRDGEFQQALVNSPMYRSLRPRPTQMILEAIDEASRARYAEDIIVNSPLTVEHVLPQGAKNEHWPLELHGDEDEWQAQARRDLLTHCLGNLTLLTQPLNSSVSNGPYGGENGKRRAIGRSRLALNGYFADVDEWNEAAIRERAEKLATVALEIWPGP